MSKLWHYSQKGQSKGPVPDDVFHDLAAAGLIQPSDMVWHSDLPEWIAASSVSGLFANSPPRLPAAILATRQGEQTEKTFLQEGEITVTSARVIATGETYALANITSVKRGPVETPYTAATWGMGIALFLTVGGFQSESPGVGVFFLLAALGCMAAFFVSPTHTVVLTTAGTERKAFQSQDEGLINRVIHAINQAIAARG